MMNDGDDDKKHHHNKSSSYTFQLFLNTRLYPSTQNKPSSTPS